MTRTTEQLRERIRGLEITLQHKNWEAVKADLECLKELLAVREAQSAHSPIAFSENADADMCRAWAWEQVKKDVTTDSWTVGDSCNFYGFYCWGWDMRRQYNEQRPPAAPDFGALTKLIVGRLIDCGTASDDSIADAEVFVYNACRAAMLNGSGVLWSGFDPARDYLPAVPDGNQVVPIKPSEAMINAGREIDSSPLNMSPRHRVELIYRAMLAAAPTPTRE